MLTEIDVKYTLKQKLDVDFKKYKILGACNPSFTHKALQGNMKMDSTMIMGDSSIMKMHMKCMQIMQVDMMDKGGMKSGNGNREQNRD